MVHPGKTRNYKNVWLISLLLVVLGIVLTIDLATLRFIGFGLLVVGGAGLVWSITHMEKNKEQENPLHEDHRKFMN